MDTGVSFDIVDIDRYFSKFVDDEEDAKQTISIRGKNKQSKFFEKEQHRALLFSRISEAVLEPYCYQSSLLVLDKKFSRFELESAYRAVLKLREQLKEPSVVTIPPALPDRKTEVGYCGSPQLWKNKFLSLKSKVNKWTRHRPIFTAIAVAIAVGLSYGSVTHSFCFREKLCSSSISQWIEDFDLSKFKIQIGARPAKVDADTKLFLAALRQAHTAHQATKVAVTDEDWQEIKKDWENAIEILEQISEPSHLYEKAQGRIKLYHQALHNLHHTDNAFNAGVRSAEEASQLIQTAQTEAEWRTVVAKWREALNHMDSVPGNSQNYAIARSKLAEYAIKFAYAQEKYLDTKQTPSVLQQEGYSRQNGQGL